MPHLAETLKKSLRPGDAVAQFSDSQYVILLSACTYEGGMLAANRIISKFYQNHKVYRNLKIKIHIEKVKTAENILNKYSG
jgi:GGDEF domain-containing protein